MALVPPQAGPGCAALALLIIALVAGSVTSSWFGIASHYDALRADKNADEANTAKDEANAARDETRQKLRTSLLAQAQAGRAGDQMGRRFEGLRTLTEAAEIRPGLDLRNEAIACMALVDLRVAKEWEGCPGDTSQITCVFFDTRLEQYARSDPQGNISVRRVADDQEVRLLSGFGQPAQVLQFSPDGKLLAARYLNLLNQPETARICLWSLAAGSNVLELSPPAIGSMDFSPDGRLLAVGHAVAPAHPEALVIYSTATGETVRKVRVGGVAGAGRFRFHPQGHQLAGVSGSSLWIKDVASGDTVLSTSLGHFINDLAWHPHGMLLAAAHDGRISLFDLHTRTPKQVDTEGVVQSLNFNHAGDLLAATTPEGGLSLRSPWSGKKLLDLANVHQRGWGRRSQFSPDDKLGYGISGTKLRLWQVERGREFAQLYGAGVSGAAFHRDGRLIAFSDALGVGLWDLAYRKPLAFFHALYVKSLHFHPTGTSLVVSQDRTLSRWPLRAVQEGMTEGFELGPREMLLETTLPNGQAASSPDGTRLAVATPSNGLLINWDDPRQQTGLQGHDYMAYVSISPDGAWIATGARDRPGVKIWDGKTGKFVSDLPDRLHGARVEFSPDGRWLMTSEEREYRLWEVGRWTPGRRLARKGGGAPGPMAFSPDGRIAALASGADTIQLVEVASGDEIATLIAPDRRFFDGLCFSPDGTRLAVAASDGVQVWDLRAIRERLAPMGLDWAGLAYAAEQLAGAPSRMMKLDVLDAAFFERRADEHAKRERSREAAATTPSRPCSSAQPSGAPGIPTPSSFWPAAMSRATDRSARKSSSGSPTSFLGAMHRGWWPSAPAPSWASKRRPSVCWSSARKVRPQAARLAKRTAPCCTASANLARPSSD